MDTKGILKEIRFDSAGLVLAIAQQHDTGEVLMAAWMNADALTETIETGRVCYWSRSRGKLWRKGETSGQVQALKETYAYGNGEANSKVATMGALNLYLNFVNLFHIILHFMGGSRD